MRKVEKYPLCAQGVCILCVKQHIVLGMTLDSSLTRTPHIKRLKLKLTAFINIVKYICGTRWGTSVSSLLHLYNALFVGLFSYGLPVLHGVSHSNMIDLEHVQAQALRICLGLPSKT